MNFELHVTLPTDTRFAATARELAVHAARHAGCSDASAHTFGAQVEEVLCAYLGSGGVEPSIPLVFRRTAGPVEVLINGRTLTIEP